MQTTKQTVNITTRNDLILTFVIIITQPRAAICFKLWGDEPWACPGSYNGGVHVVGVAGPGVFGDVSPPVGSRGKAPIGGLGDKVPQKLK